MEVFEVVIGLLLAGAALTAISRRIGAPYPALVALAGAALALVPGTPAIALDPALALTLFVAPVLLDSAFDASERDLRADWLSVTGLAVGAVALTTLAVAGVIRWLVPGMPWAIALAIGAIVAPPDAAAAGAVLDALRPPHRLLVLLEGESLFNDASALLVFRLALGAAVAGELSLTRIVPTLLVATGGSALLGFVLARVITPLIARIQDVAIAVVVQFCGTFAVWILAERLGLSGILTVVAFAMVASRRQGAMQARVRVPSYAVWEFAVFVLNVLAFIVVGLQLKAILGRVDAATLLQYGRVAGAALLATILARLAWVLGTAALGRWWCRPRPVGKPARRDPVGLSAREAAVVGWCGMRGIVTLAASLALPADLPFRDLAVFTAFSVVLGTLVLQGLTLRPLLAALRLEDDGAVEREVRLARVEALRASHAAASRVADDELSRLLARRYEVLLQRAEADRAAGDGHPEARGTGQPEGFDVGTRTVREATAAARRRLLALLEDGTIGDEAFQQVEQELDLEELNFQPASPGPRP